MLESLFAPGISDPHCSVLVSGPFLRFDIEAFRSRLAVLASGGCVAYAVRLDGRLLARMATLATLRLRLRRAKRAIERAGARLVGTFGVDPVLDAPAIVYEMSGAAADYAERNLRPRGSHAIVRRLIKGLLGCDPALGGLIVVARKL